MTIERAAANTAPATPPNSRPPSYQSHSDHHDRGYGHHRPHKRRKSWLEEIFD
jgi:Zn-finger nucleic acid-binding protein